MKNAMAFCLDGMVHAFAEGEPRALCGTNAKYVRLPRNGDDKFCVRCLPRIAEGMSKAEFLRMIDELSCLVPQSLPRLGLWLVRRWCAATWSWVKGCFR